MSKLDSKNVAVTLKSLSLNAWQNKGEKMEEKRIIF